MPENQMVTDSPAASRTTEHPPHDQSPPRQSGGPTESTAALSARLTAALSGTQYTATVFTDSVQTLDWDRPLACVNATQQAQHEHDSSGPDRWYQILLVRSNSYETRVAVHRYVGSANQKSPGSLLTPESDATISSYSLETAIDLLTRDITTGSDTHHCENTSQHPEGHTPSISDSSGQNSSSSPPAYLPGQSHPSSRSHQPSSPASSLRSATDDSPQPASEPNSGSDSLDIHFHVYPRSALLICAGFLASALAAVVFSPFLAVGGFIVLAMSLFSSTTRVGTL